MKKAICAILFCVTILLSAFAIASCGDKNIKPSVTLENWQDETIEVDLHSDVSLSTDAVYDTNGKAYAVIAEVTTKSGDPVLVLGGKFTADYAGGYKIVYSLHDVSVQAKTRTVTVNIKNSDTPVPYFMKSNITVYENTEFAVPEYGVSIAPEISYTQKLSLYSVMSGEEETRTLVSDSPAARLTLPAGNYVFVLSVEAGEKSGSAELLFRVRLLDELNAISSLNSESEINLGASFWSNDIGGWDARNVTFSAAAARDEHVSRGAAVTELPAAATETYFSVRPDLARTDFVRLMSQDGAVLSVWIKIDSELKKPHTVAYGDYAERKTVVCNDGEWMNLLMSLEDFGVDDADVLYDKLRGSSGNHMNSPFSVRHADSEGYTVTVDSIYVAMPLSATMEDKTVAYGSTDTVTAESEDTDEFIYTLYDIAGKDDVPTVSGNGEFTFDVAGKLEVSAAPMRNRFYLPAPLSATVTVAADESISFAKEKYTLDSGINDIPACTFPNSVAYRIDTSDGSPNYAYLNGFNVPEGISIAAGKIRVFEGDYKLYAFAEKNGVKYSAFTRITVPYDATKSNGDIVLFSNPSDIASVHANEGQFYSYVGDYQGESGVVKFSAGAAGTWSQLRLDKVLYSAAELKTQDFGNEDYLVMRVYAENLPRGYYAYFSHAYGDSADMSVAYLKNNAWQDLYVKAKEFLEYEENWVDKGNRKKYAGFCFTNNGTNSAEIYVDSIKLVKNVAQPVNTEAENVEYNAFEYATDIAAVAYNNLTNVREGAVITRENGAYNGKENVVNLSTFTQEVWPMFSIPARATKDVYTQKLGNGTGWKFKMDICARANHGGSTVTFSGEGYKSADIAISDAWSTVEFPADKVLAALGDDGSMRGGFILGAAGNSVMYDVLIANLRFEPGGIETDLTQAGVLTVPTGATVKHGQTTLTKTSTADNKDSYNLAALISESDWGSQDIVVTVSKQGLEDVSVTWSSPAAENEINGFGSVKATNEFTANPHPDCAVSVIPEHNGRKGVAQIECRKTEEDIGWANFRYGAPLLTVEQAAVYMSNPYAYIAIDIAANKNVTVDFRVDNEVKGKFTATTEWQTWRLPASLFNAAKFASGAIFSNVETGGSKPTIYIDSVRFEIVMPEIVANVTEAGILTVPTASVVKVGNKTLVKTGTADNKDSYNLAAETNNSVWGSQDVVASIVLGEKSATVTWSSPAAENEINGFGSVKATNEFTANPHPDCAVSVIPEHNGRKGVAQIECRKTEEDIGWANFRYGAPLLTVEQAAVYMSNPYAYIAIDIAANKNVTVDFRVDNEVKGKFTATTEWQTWRLPASLFNAAKFASGAIFSNVETGGSKPTIYIDSVRFEIVMPEIVANVTEAGILTVPTASVVKVGNKTLVKTGTADNKDSYNLAAETNNSVWGSQDVVASIVLGEKSATVTWSSPAGEGEINGFGSEKARNNFKTNQHTDVTVSFVDSYTDKNGVTKNGVAKLALRNNTGSDTWANFRFGKAMLTEEAANAYVNNANAYVVITMMVKSKDDTETSIKVDYSMGTSWDWTCTVTSEWKEYKIPIRYFAYPSGGDHPFLNATNNDGVVDQTLYIDSIRLVAEEPAK